MAEAVTLDRSKNPNYPRDPATVKHQLDTAKALLSDPKTDPDSRREAAAIVARLEKSGVSESRQRKLNEALLMEDPIYRDFKRIGRYIAEQKLSQAQILQIFADAETGMTDKATGANRTFLGKGKDATVDFAKDVAGAVKGVLNSIQIGRAHV